MDKLKAALYTAVSLQRYLVNIVHSQDYISLSVVNNLHLTLIRKPSCYIGWSYFTFTLSTIKNFRKNYIGRNVIVRNENE